MESRELDGTDWTILINDERYLTSGQIQRVVAGNDTGDQKVSAHLIFQFELG